MNDWPLSPEALRHTAPEAWPKLAACHGRFVGGRQMKRPDGSTVQAGQSFALCMVPQDLSQPLPVIMIHGGGGQGTDFLFTPDGRPGWAAWFLQAGHAVYIVDRPGHGRAPWHEEALGPMTPLPCYEDIAPRFTAARTLGTWPEAELHSQWPDDGTGNSPTLAQLMGGMGPMHPDLASMQELARDAGAALLDLTGPAILLTQSQGGPCGWLIADARPDLVRAIIAVEPLSPPFLEHPLGQLAWGLTAAPMVFEPPAKSPEPLTDGQHRRLPGLQGVPIVVVTSESSWMAGNNHLVVEFLTSHGAATKHLRLADHGMHGNGHMMMLERNSDQVADLLIDWIAKYVGDDRPARN